MKIPTGEPIGMSDTLEGIWLAVWLIFILYLINSVFRYIQWEKRRSVQSEKGVDWSDLVEKWYSAGQYDSAISTLKTTDTTNPNLASVNWWLGRCYFQKSEWGRAALYFEKCVLIDPFYRASVKDYMAFIEINNLVCGVSGYAKS